MIPSRLVGAFVAIAAAVLVCFLIGGALDAAAHELPDPIPAPPARPSPQGGCRIADVVVEGVPDVQVEVMRWPFGLKEAEAQRLQRLDDWLTDVEKLRRRVEVPRLVLPGPGDGKADLSVDQYEAELRNLAAQLTDMRTGRGDRSPTPPSGRPATPWGRPLTIDDASRLARGAPP